jgi:RNA polymerase primary sigma factor
MSIRAPEKAREAPHNHPNLEGAELTGYSCQFANLVIPHSPACDENTPLRALYTWTKWEKSQDEMKAAGFTHLPDFLFTNPPLTRETERRLIETVHKGGPEGEEAREILITSNLKLVSHFAHRYERVCSPGFGIEDLFQEGVLGLSHAIDLFDLQASGNNRFTTYAGAHIWAAMRRALTLKSDAVHYPDRYRRAAWVVLRVGEALTQELGRDPTYGEVSRRAAETNHSLSIDPALIRYLFENGFLQNHPPAENHFREHLPHLLPSNSHELSELSERAGNRALIAEALYECSASFPPRTQEILAMRYPLDPEKKPLTLEEVGNVFGLSKQAISLIERKVLDTLRKRLRQRGIGIESLW